jgi:hypothetical protein
MRLILLCASALLLAGCVSTTSSVTAARPKTIVVSDLVFGPNVVAVDRSFTARLERKIGSFPTHERKQRTNERVNDEIVAAMIATLREGGLEAMPGSEDGLSLSDDAVVLSGKLRADESGPARKAEQIGFGPGRGGVIVDMTVSKVSSFGKKQLTAFSIEPPSGKAGAAKSAAAKAQAARNAAIAEALAAENAAPEKLSADVETPARKLGAAAAEKVLVYAREQGWLTAADMAAAETEKPLKLPARKPARQAVNDAAAQ